MRLAEASSRVSRAFCLPTISESCRPAMSERAVDQLSGLVARLNRKAADALLLLFNHKSAGSLGALAGLAIAVAFAWKLLRSPPGRRRRGQPKRRDAPSTSAGRSTAGRAVNSGVEIQSAVPSPKELDAVELTLGQIVRKKLNGCRKMTCQLLGVILEQTSSEQLQKHATVRPSVVEIVLEIAKSCDLYLMETVLDNESEERVLFALESAGLFQTGGLVKEKVLFCSTEIGRTSFVRQLEADWHVDTNLDIISQLARFIRCQLHISSNVLVQMPPNVFSSTSLEQYFSCLG